MISAEHVQYNAPDNNHGDGENAPAVQLLAEEEPGNEDRRHDADAAPGRIRQAQI